MQVVGHGYSPGDQAYISGVVGMTQINGTIITITSLNSADNFNFTPATVGFSAYVSGGTASPTNAILTAYPNIYLHGCLLEAAIFLGDDAKAARFLGL